MFLINPAMVDIDIGTAGLVGILGYGVVFIGLIALMIVIMVVGKVMTAKKGAKAPKTAPAPAPVAAAPVVPVTAAPVAAPAAADAPAPGSAGPIKLYDVDPKRAALLMAIVAYKLDKPLNELRFKSIKEVK